MTCENMASSCLSKLPRFAQNRRCYNIATGTGGKPIATSMWAEANPFGYRCTAFTVYHVCEASSAAAPSPGGPDVDLLCDFNGARIFEAERTDPQQLPRRSLAPSAYGERVRSRTCLGR